MTYGDILRTGLLRKVVLKQTGAPLESEKFTLCKTVRPSQQQLSSCYQRDIRELSVTKALIVFAKKM